MRLDHATWEEVEDRIAKMPGIILPAGSTEQHGPMGLIGTDALCAGVIAEHAADKVGCLVAPVLAYTPADFNMAFAGTISVSPEVFKSLVTEIVSSLESHGFRLIYILNGHGANLAPLREVADITHANVHVRSWWDFEPVNALRQELYGDWEGMHATPSEIAITQAVHRTISGKAQEPPRKLSAEYIADHAGDRHGPPAEHRETFPDGRVGSHSALARPEHGHALLSAAVDAVAADFLTQLKTA